MSFLAARSPFKAHVSPWGLVSHSRHTPGSSAPGGGGGGGSGRPSDGEGLGERVWPEVVLGQVWKRLGHRQVFSLRIFMQRLKKKKKVHFLFVCLFPRTFHKEISLRCYFR